ncbi:MAG TPA: tagatose 1,6-diphosphate aldolase [Anaerolineae bacterium]|nr:tagatose 1,6-diphosphate aldolase [Anaerolineae bacterium]
MTALSIGKLRGLQQCATTRGAFAVLALDHRNNLRRAFHPAAPGLATDEEMIAFKREVVEALAPATSAVLLDPEFGAAQSVATNGLPGRIGLLVALEATGYTGEPLARASQLLPGWSVAKAKRMGASAVKLLVYYHPDAPTAESIEALVRQVVADCATHELPLFLEPLSYSLDPAQKTLTPDERRRVVLETARRLTALGVDILKAEFPLDTTAIADVREWDAACLELTAASAAPWVLLSASVDYATYLRQVTVACHAGAAGVAAGRAVWQEAVTLAGAARIAFLGSIARERMQRLTEVCAALARPWTEYYTAPEVGPDWYQGY